jgi:PAS domain S-box-containing protein
MSTDPSSSRLAIPSSRRADTTPLWLVSLLARTRQIAAVLPHLHQYALERTGGDAVLLFEHNPRSGILHATAGYGLNDLRLEAWTASDEEEHLAATALRDNLPTFIADLEREMPELASRLQRPAALLVPLVRGADAVGLVAIGFSAPADLATPGNVTDLQDAFLVSLELCQLRRGDELQNDVRELVEDFSRTLSASLNLGEALERFCGRANHVFAADRTSVWIHDRRSRQLVLHASSESVRPDELRLSVDDPFAPAAVALRGVRAQLSPASVDGEHDTVTVPLRGCRRALGTLIFEGVRVESGSELELLDRADHLGRQLASDIEAMQLLDEVVRARRETADIINVIRDLVVVSDERGRIIHANEPFAARTGIRRQDLTDRLVTTVVGPELAAWLAARLTSRDTDERGHALVDSILGGPLLVTVVALRHHDSETAGHVVIARDLESHAGHGPDA